MKLLDQWQAIQGALPSDWSEVRLRVRPEQASELGEAARILGSIGAGRVADELAVTVRRAGGSAGPEAAGRLFAYLDDARVWCELSLAGTTAAVPDPVTDGLPPEPLAGAWDGVLAALPADWSDLLCRLELESSALLDRAALLCAPVNPARDGDDVAFLFRAARRAGYGASPAMVRRCLERLDAEGIPGEVAVLRQLSETDPVATHGAVL